MREGDLLNLRDIETALENLRRLQSVDNPLGLSDMFYVHYSHDLGHKVRARNEYTGEKLKSGTEGHGVGLRGQLQAGGAFYYDLFAAWPTKHPSRFPARHSVMGGTLSYSF